MHSGLPSSPLLLCTQLPGRPSLLHLGFSPVVEKESTPGLSFIHAHEAAMKGKGERDGWKGNV